MHKIRKSNINDFNKIYSYVSNTYFRFNDVEAEEKEILSEYIKNSITENIDNYNMVLINEKVIGLYLVLPFKDGLLLDDIFIEEEYRNNFIGSSIIEQLQKESIIYLNVYKNNLKAIALYERLGFEKIDDTINRYHMKSNKIEKSN